MLTAHELKNYIVNGLACDHAEVLGDRMRSEIHAPVNANAVVLYMKGTPQFPQCGFSGATVQMLQACGLRDFAAVNVLADPDIRAGIKAYANWPTIPQLYVNGELVGGADIVREMYESGELQMLVNPVGAS